MASVSDSMSKVIQELFMPLVNYYLPKTSPTWDKVKLQGGKSASMDRLGRDWKIIWPFQVGLAGAAQFGPIAGPDIATTPGSTGATTMIPADFQMYKDVETWPGLSESTAPAFFQKNITLKRMKVDFHIPSQVMRLAQLKACVGDQVMATLKGTAKRVDRLMCTAWFSQLGNSLQNALGSFTSGTGTYINVNGYYNGAAYGEIDLHAAGTSNAVPNSFAKWTPGMAVDLYVYNSNTRVNAYPVFVSRPSGINRTAATAGGLYLCCPGGTVTLATTTAYHIVPRNSGRESGLNYLPTALDSCIISSGSVFGINVAEFPWFQSIVDTTARVPTETELGKFLAELEMYGADWDEDSIPDTFLMTPGVMNRYYQDYMGTRIKVTSEGGAMDVSGGVKPVATYTLFGRDYEFRTERWLPQKHGYMLKLQNNWEIVRPPRLPGTKSQPGFDASLEFLAPLWTGQGNIFLPAYQVGGGSAGAFTNFGHAPAEMIYEVLPKTFGGWIKFTNLTESYVS